MTGRELLYPSEQRDSAESMEESHPGCWKGTQLPPMPATNPQEVGFLLPQFRCAPNKHLHVSSSSQLPCSSMERDAGSEVQMSGYI